MRSYYNDMAILIERSHKPKFITGQIQCLSAPLDLDIFKKDSIFKKIKQWFAKFKKPKEDDNKFTISDLPKPDHSLLRTYTSYSGADLVVTVDNKVVGELTNIRWYKPHKEFIEQLDHSDYYDKDLAMKKPVTVLAEFAIFDKDAFGEGLNDATIVMTYANEYGQSSYRAIHGVQSLYETGGTSVDDITIDGYMILAADEVTELKPSVLTQQQKEDMKNFDIRLGL